MIRDGRLAPAARLPSTRELATDLRVSRNTVMLAYEQLLAEGYVVSRNRATTLVAGVLPTSATSVSPRSKPGHPAPVSAYARRLTELLHAACALDRSPLRLSLRRTVRRRVPAGNLAAAAGRAGAAHRPRRVRLCGPGRVRTAARRPRRIPEAGARGRLRGGPDRDHQRLAAGLRSRRARPARSGRRRGGRGAALHPG